MSTPTMRFTAAGLALRNRNSAGERIRITRLAMGDGRLASTDGILGLTGLVHEVTSIEINATVVQERHVVVSGQLAVDKLTAPFRWRELGVFACGEDGVEILYGYLYLGDDGDVVSPEGKLLERTIAVAVVVGDTANVTVSLDPLKWAGPIIGIADQADDLAPGGMLIEGKDKDGVLLGNRIFIKRPDGTVIVAVVAPMWEHVDGKPETFPPATHTHAASDINSGTIPLNRGGTGAATAAAARTSLGAAPLASPAFTGTPKAPSTSTSYTTYQLRNIALMTEIPSSIGNGQIALIYE